MQRVAGDGDDVDRLRLVRVYVDGKTEIGGKISADFGPGISGIVAAHDVPVFLHEEQSGLPRIHSDVVHAMPNFSQGIGNVLRVKSLVDRLPRFSAVVGAKRSRRGDSDVHPLRILRVKNDGMQTHAAGSRLPLWTSAMTAKAGELVPAPRAVRGTK